jgi:hypothetical protein
VALQAGQSWGNPASPGDGERTVEAALARTLDRASEAGRFDVVAQLAKALEARRLAPVLDRRNKGDRLAAYEHLVRRCGRDRTQADRLDDAFRRAGCLADRKASQRITRWAYEQLESTRGLVWVRADDLVALDARWRLLPELAA